MLKKYLDDAILLEEKGSKLYQELAAAAGNKLSKALFESLALQEQYHLKIIKNFADNAEYQKVDFDPLEKVIRTIFEELSLELKAKDSSQIEGIESALKMEKAGYAAYKQAYESAESDADKEFLSFLMNMETEHYESLANLYYYYTESDKWLAEDESKVWNWMNF